MCTAIQSNHQQAIKDSHSNVPDIEDVGHGRKRQKLCTEVESKESGPTNASSLGQAKSSNIMETSFVVDSAASKHSLTHAQELQQFYSYWMRFVALEESVALGIRKSLWQDRKDLRMATGKSLFNLRLASQSALSAGANPNSRQQWRTVLEPRATSQDGMSGSDAYDLSSCNLFPGDSIFVSLEDVSISKSNRAALKRHGLGHLAGHVFLVLLD